MRNWPHKRADLETFLSFDRATRRLVLRLIAGIDEGAFEELDRHPQAKTLASWLLTLPAYQDEEVGR